MHLTKSLVDAIERFAIPAAWSDDDEPTVVKPIVCDIRNNRLTRIDETVTFETLLSTARKREAMNFNWQSEGISVRCGAFATHITDDYIDFMTKNLEVHTSNGLCYRLSDEPTGMLSEQWFAIDRSLAIPRDFILRLRNQVSIAA